MKKLIKLAIACAAAGLLFCQGIYAETVEVVNPQPLPPGRVVEPVVAEPVVGTAVSAVPVVGATSVTVERVGPAGYHVCYVPLRRHVQASGFVRRCGPYRCEDF